MFGFLPPDEKCEWTNLIEFVRQYNDKFGVQYSLAKCLDISDSTKPQPEVLLKCPGEKDMVIERKAFIFQSEYPSSRRIEEEFCDYLKPKVNSAFRDTTFVLEVSLYSLHGSKQYRMDIAQQIADMILQSIDYIKSGGSITSQTPIPWALRRLSESELEDYEDKINRKGIVVTISGNWTFDLPDEMQIRSAEKDMFAELNKTLFLESYGDSDILCDDDLEVALHSVKTPVNIDQIWMADVEWISADDWVIKYRQIVKNP